MKKFLTLAAALALVLGLSQCKKVRPDMPHYSGQVGDMYVQHVTVGASHGSSNSKVSGSQLETALNLVWDKGDVINVYNQTKNVSLSNPLTLKGEANKAEGQFEGNITATTGDNLTFYYKGSEAEVVCNEGVVTYAASNFKDQDGTLTGENGIFKRLLIMKKDVAFPLESGSTLELSVPYAILKLDLSAFGTAEGTKVTISADGSEVASVTGVKTDSKEVYVAMPEAESREYTFSGNNYYAYKTWKKLDKNTFYTKEGSNTGEAIEIKPDAVDLGLTSGLLWATRNVGATNGATAESWYGDYYAWGEVLPYYADGYAHEITCSHWRSMTTGAGNTTISDGYEWKTYSQDATISFTEWTIHPYGSDNKLKSEYDAAHAVMGETWRMPTADDWQELINNNTLENLSAGVTSSYVESFTAVTAGYLVLKGRDSNLDNTKYMFLPAAGIRDGVNLYVTVIGGFYWSSSLDLDHLNCAWYLNFDFVYLKRSGLRYSGMSVRAVR